MKLVLLNKQWMIILALSCSVFGLIGCQKPPVNNPLIEDEPRLPSAVVGASDGQIAYLQKRFNQQQIKVVVMGDDYLISIPASVIFADQSPRIQWKAYAVLNEVACYLRQYRKVGVQVITYVSPYGSKRREYSLSTTRSEVVANYLWSQGIDSRLIVALGQGSEKPVVVKNPPSDKGQNARIEITFRRVEA